MILSHFFLGGGNLSCSLLEIFTYFQCTKRVYDEIFVESLFQNLKVTAVAVSGMLIVKFYIYAHGRIVIFYLKKKKIKIYSSSYEIRVRKKNCIKIVNLVKKRKRIKIVFFFFFYCKIKHSNFFSVVVIKM